MNKQHTSRPRTELVRILLQLAGHYRKPYCWPSQNKILALYTRYTGCPMSLRTLNAHLAALEASGWITRTKRHRVEPGRGMTFHSTLYRFGRRAINAAAAIAIGIAYWAGPATTIAAQKPSAIPSSISVQQVHDDQGRPPKPGGSANDNKVALRALEDARRILRHS